MKLDRHQRKHLRQVATKATSDVNMSNVDCFSHNLTDVVFWALEAKAEGRPLEQEWRDLATRVGFSNWPE